MWRGRSAHAGLGGCRREQLEQHGAVNRLGQVMIEASLVCAVLIFLLPIAGYSDESRLPRRRVIANVAGHIVAVHARQPDVEHDEFGMERRSFLQRAGPIKGDPDLVAGQRRASSSSSRQPGDSRPRSGFGARRMVLLHEPADWLLNPRRSLDRVPAAG